MNKSLSEIYDNFADTYEKNRCLFDMSDVFNEFYNRFELKRGNLLDLGCGAGEPFAANFIKRGWSVTGVDFSHRMLDLAAKYVPEMNTIYSDMRSVDFEAEQFDAVTIIYALFHIPHTEHDTLLKRIFRWLKPNGKLLFTYATKEYTGKIEFDGYKEFFGQQLYYSHKRPEQLYSILKEGGYIIEAKDYRTIGNEIFLWITASKPCFT
jgi:ubiquinone/menaquinone biosynthesis C-methylase UbiE